MPNEKNICPVCGYKLDEPPYDEAGYASFNICPSCGTEFGYHDATKSHAELRMTWLQSGAKWWSRHESPPEGWNPEEQLRRAGFID